jgi:CRP-like cAMP-binding protein
MRVKASAESLGRLPLFSECDRTHLQMLAFSSRRCSFAAGDAIIREGTAGNTAYLILDGLCDVSIGEGQKARQLGEAGPGLLLGELAMIAGGTYSISATARQDVEAAAIERDTFLRLAGEFPEFAARVHKALSRKLEATMSDLVGAKSAFEGARAFAR